MKQFATKFRVLGSQGLGFRDLKFGVQGSGVKGFGLNQNAGS